MKTLLKKAMGYAAMICIVLACEKPPAPDRDPVLSVPPVHTLHISSVKQFGENLGPGKENPAFEYILFKGVQWILAAEEGTVEAVIRNQGLNDYEIRIRLNPTWLVIYDHISEPLVASGEEVTAGQVLGNVGDGNRFELQLINKDGISYCPFTYASNTFIGAHQQVIPSWCLKDSVIGD